MTMTEAGGILLGLVGAAGSGAIVGAFLVLAGLC